MAILNDDEFVEIDGRAYANPQVVLDESNAFIENLRNTQQANNQQIQTDTYNLGTAVPSNLGGLTSPVGEGGAGDAGLSYFTSRYQTPQTNAAVENLRAIAQASALNQALENEQAIWKKKYQDAYRSYQKSAYNRSIGSGGSGGKTGDNVDNTSGWQGDTKDNATDFSAGEALTLSTETPGDMGKGVKWVVNPATIGQSKLEYYRIDTSKDKNDPEYQILYRQQDDGTLVRAR